MSASKPAVSDPAADRALCTTAVLAADEPPAVEWLNPEGTGPFVFGCEHASNRIPARFGTMGLPEADLSRHIAWDIGARRLTELLARQTDSPAILQRYSRLVYDCNRTVGHPGAFVTDADGSRVTGNLGLTDADKAARERAIYRPFHEALTDTIERRQQRAERFAFIAVHSFNQSVRGVARPWHIGFIYNQQPALSQRLIRWFRDNTDYVVGDNEPYSPLHAVDHTIRIQAEVRGVAYSMIEVRNDLLRSEPEIAGWADLIAAALRDAQAS
jgi:predicted N-formylglutamate amidohydrolase